MFGTPQLPYQSAKRLPYEPAGRLPYQSGARLPRADILDRVASLELPRRRSEQHYQPTPQHLSSEQIIEKKLAALRQRRWEEGRTRRDNIFSER
jgi:hypothetical protein